MRATLVALFLLTAPAAAYSLQDAEVDCRRGPRIARACRLDCRAEATTARAYETGSWRLKLQQCMNICDAIKVALEECKIKKQHFRR